MVSIRPRDNRRIAGDSLDGTAGAYGGLNMCNDFECVHDQCGICSYTDQDCEYEECLMWDDCIECIYGFKCCPEGEEEE